MVFGINNSAQTQRKYVFSSISITSSSISIDGDIQLAHQASKGDGSNNNPYIIENIINDCTSNVNGINIQNTDKYFVLRNITVSHCNVGMYFLNVTHGNIINSYVTFNAGEGFWLDSSSQNVLANNTAMNNYIGFNVFSSTNISLISNTATFNHYTAFYLGNSSKNTLTNNTATNNFYVGFHLESSSQNVLTSNTAIKDYVGFWLDSFSSQNILTNNVAINNSNTNFYIGNLSENVLESNIEQNNLINSSSSTTATTSSSDNFLDLFTIISGIIIVIISSGVLIMVRRSSNKINNTEVFKNTLGLPNGVKNISISMSCPICGIKTFPGDQYCMNCGTKLRP